MTPGELTSIDTTDQALAWAEQVVRDAEAARSACSSRVAGVRDLKRAYVEYLMKHGCAEGVVVTLLRCRLLEAVAYSAFVERLRQTVAPTTTSFDR